MTPAEQARAEVEAVVQAWCVQWRRQHGNEHWSLEDSLIARLTPIFERAQQQDAVLKLQAEADAKGMWQMLLEDHTDLARLCDERDALRERAERAEDRARVFEEQAIENFALCERAEAARVAADEAHSVTFQKLHAAEAKQHATRDELKQRDGTIIDLRAELEVVSAERDSWTADADLYCRNAEYHKMKREAAEADVARLREALGYIANDLKDTQDYGRSLVLAEDTLAATEPK